MQWKSLLSSDELKNIMQASQEKPQIIFKHSTRCSISSTALNRMERKWQTGTDDGYADIWYLDLIAHRDISNGLAEMLGVQHESPQLLLVHKGHCVYHRSHFDIDYQEVMATIKGS